MKNTLTINTLKNYTCDCIDSVYDGSNSIFLLFITDRNSKVEFSNGKTFEITPEINSIFVEQDWYSNSDLNFIFSNDDHVSSEFTIKKPTSTEGNMTLQMIDNFNYQVKFHKSSGGGTPYTLPAATTTNLGGVIVGDNLTVEESGRLNANKYTLPPATKTLLGGVIPGNGITVDSDGKIAINVIGGGIERTTIFEGEIRGVGSTGECSQSIENFDYLLMYYKPDYEAGSISVNERKLSLEDVSTLTNYSDNSFSYVYFYSRFFRGTFTDSKHFKVLFNEYYANYTISLVKIVGVKLLNHKQIQYSTQEQVVGKWIDGKPIYQKTYSNNGSALNLPIDVSNLNIDKLVNWEAACSDTQEYGPVMWTINSCSGIDGRSLYIQDNQIKTTGSYYRHFITIQFTKTTD